MSPRKSITSAATNLAMLREQVIGNRLLAVHESQEPTVFYDRESVNPEQEWVYWNWYLELENGLLLLLEQYTLEILESFPEPTHPAGLCATRMGPEMREFRDLSGSETAEFLRGRQITQIIADSNEDVELRSLFAILDQDSQLYVANKWGGNRFQMDKLDLEIDLTGDDEQYTTIPDTIRCDALGRTIPFPGQSIRSFNLP